MIALEVLVDLFDGDLPMLRNRSFLTAELILDAEEELLDL